ncbi:MAG TPA: hypothetical protein VMI54_13620 [Polyangiaceae bacterium]|nr:hypothetical protein [Polyangiaceae bacterium]
MNLRPLATIALIAASCFWACEPDLGALSSQYTASGGMGATPATGGTGAVAGKAASGGTGGSDALSGGTGGDMTMPEGGSGDTAGAAGEPGESGAGGSGGTGGGGTGGGTGGSSGTAGTGGSSTQSSCSDGTTDSGETDVDCGGSTKCARCATNLHCSANSDCESGFCKNKICTAPTCADGVKNQDETGKDCGGSSCPPCADGVTCVTDDDCAGEFCKSGVCTDHCTSMRQEADETDVDCGGKDCDPCADKKKCVTASDCVSLNCGNNKCVPATCSDGIKNQGEGDVDCGAVCADQGKWCTVAMHNTCNLAEDCASSVCTSGKCGTDIVIPPGDVIDDFEDGDQYLPMTNGRVGNWYAYNDGTTTGTPMQSMSMPQIPGHRGDASVFGMHATGSGYTNWGCGFGADLDNGGTGQSSKVPYDATFDDDGTPTLYAGVTFWAKSDMGPLAVSVVLPDGDTDAAGNICNQNPVPSPGSGAGVCDHHWLASVQLGSDWQRFTVLFSDLKLESGGNPVPTSFDPSRIVSVQFRILPGTTFDFWVDDVAFVRPQ